MVANGEIKAVDIATGGIRTLGRAPDGAAPYGGAWSGEDILLGGPRLRRLSIADGHVTDLYPADPGVSRQGLPSFLPDGQTCPSQDSDNPARRGVFLGALDSPRITRLLPETSEHDGVPRGYFFYIRQGTVFAQRFDLDHNRTMGDPVGIGSGIESFGPLIGYAVNGDTVVWSSGQVIPPGRLTWVDRNGRKVDEIGEVHRYRQIALAPDGQRVVTEEVDPRLAGKQGNSSMFLIDLTRPIHARLTTGNDGESDPIWSPDSHEVAFHSEGGVFKRKIDQPGRTNLFAGFAAGVEDWTHDGRFVILWTQHAKRLRAAAWRRSKANPPDSVLFNGR